MDIAPHRIETKLTHQDIFYGGIAPERSPSVTIKIFTGTADVNYILLDELKTVIHNYLINRQ